jgi:uncharacterized membrane protein YraQ (UPF0718 family)
VRGSSQAGTDGLHRRRRGPRSLIRSWFRRHPFITMLIGIVFLGWLAWWEASRLGSAHRTVAHGWGAGVAVGLLAAIALTGAVAVMLASARDRTAVRARAHWSLITVLFVSWAICLRATIPPRTAITAPYVITTGMEVGEIAYVATCSALTAVLIAWAAVRLRRRASVPARSVPGTFGQGGGPGTA